MTTGRMQAGNAVLAVRVHLPGTLLAPRQSCSRTSLTLGAGILLAMCAVSALGQISGSSQVNCSDPAYSSTSLCRAATDPQTQIPVSIPQLGQAVPTDSGMNQRSNDSQQVYVDQAGNPARRATSGYRQEELLPPDPVTDFQRLVRSSTGEMLPIFGRDLFRQAPSTFAPADQIPVTNDYVVGPGDQVLVRLWGPESFNSQLTVDTSGSIYIPKVGAVRVAGLRADELQSQISAEVNHTFRNYRISVSLGQLRSIQVYVVGEARKPGAYTISALSTVLNALFVSGGPNVQGSLRRIQIRHPDGPPTEFDLYDLVLRGDKTKDVRLQQGDTIFIPAAGPQVALAGSVRHPAIYELRGETTTPDLLQLAGGYTSTARQGTISLERIDQDLERKALTIDVAKEGRTMALRDGDVLFVNHITQGYEQSVTIRGNLANPGRFSWHEGMRLSEILPDTKSLLTSGYWRERNRLGVPTPLFEPLETIPYRNGFPVNGQRGYPQNPYNNQSSNQLNNGYNDSSYGSNLPGNNQGAPGNQIQQSNADGLLLQSLPAPTATDATAATLFGMGVAGTAAAANGNSAGNLAQNRQGNSTAEPGALGQGPEPRTGVPPDYVEHRIQIPAPEIDWSYAVIERLDPVTLKSSLLPFHLGRLVQDHDPSQDLQLQAGDVVTILSQADIPVPLEEQTKFVRLEGEFVSAGVYSVRPGEDLESLVQRAGGLTAKAYLYGSSFLRDSARVFQQQRLNEYISSLSTDMEREAAVRAASSSTGILDPNALNEQRSLIAQLRQLRATGRVVLEFRPTSFGVDAIPKIPLENGDVFRIPSKPNTVSVVGAVYGQNVFLFDAKRRVEDYVALAGKPNRVADRKHAFIIRADGSIFSRERIQGVLSNNFDSSSIYAGDAIVIPEKLIKPSALRNALDYSQILSSFGLAAAAINVVR